MTRLDYWIDHKVFQNILSWILLWLLCAMIINAEHRLVSALGLTGFLILPVYINNLKILPLFNRANKTLGIVLFLVNAACFTLLAFGFLSYDFQKFEWRMLYNLLGMMILVLLTSSALKIARDSIYRRQQVKEAELKLLKAQLNPHFLFNTMNNLYGLSVVKSDKLPDLMLKLSDLLRYSLYDTREPLVNLEKELKYLTNYIALERIRLEAQTEIGLNITGEAGGLRIAPMLLIVFVENAFKHLGTGKDDRNFVQINLEIRGDQLLFRCVNSVEEAGNSVENMESGKSGIGLDNVKQRLALIYPNQHTLRVESAEDQFLVELTLKCA